MPTASERQALWFLAAVAVLGAGARAVHSVRLVRELSAAERLVGAAGEPGALERQIGRVDSVRQLRRSSGRSSRRGRAGSSSEASRPILEQQRVPPLPLAPVDLNVATAAEIEALPRVGPALAQRIVAWREAHGPFRSMDDLRHVRGIGPATAALLAPSVTF